MPDLGGERCNACVSDLRLLELARFRFEDRWDSRGSDGLFAFIPFVTRLEEGRSSVDNRAFVGSSVLSDVLLFRPQQRVNF